METNNKKSLLKATLFAFVVAVITLIFVILPAEYNIDPTGVGNKLGLTVFNGAEEQVSQNPNETVSDGNHSTIVTVPSGRGIEYKLKVKQYDVIKYEWFTDGPEVYVDLHGEPQNDTSGYFESYVITTTTEMKGQFTAPFDGSHGWYWKNTSDQDVKIQLIFSGSYTIEGIK